MLIYDEDTKLKFGDSCGLNIDIAGIYNCVIRFIIAISDQTINYGIPRNLSRIYTNHLFDHSWSMLHRSGHLSLT